MLKDNLKDVIRIGKKEFRSIEEVLKADYKQFKKTGDGFGIATYRNRLINLDNEDADESSFSSVQKQICNINLSYDLEAK